MSEIPRPTDNLSRDAQVQSIREYIAKKKEWMLGTPEVIGPQSVNYEGFQGPRGDSNKKTKQRIAMGILEEGEESAIEQKAQGDAAFRAGNFEEAAGHYVNSTRVWGNPQNPVCYSNLAATYLKLERYQEAETAAQNALREHFSIHGYHYGTFHIKVFHRIGLANIGLQKYEVAEQYFQRALKINPNNPAAKNDRKRAQEAIKSLGSDRKAQIEARRSSLGLTDVEMECVTSAGANPWDEDVQDLLEASGLRNDEHQPLTDINELLLPDQRAQEQDSIVKGGCHWCGSRATEVPLLPCRGCSAVLYCRNRCAVNAWKGHNAGCGDTRNAREKLKKNPKSDGILFKRMQKWLGEYSGLLTWAGLAVLGTLGPNGHRKAFERSVAILEIDYQPDETQPLVFRDFRSMEMKDAANRYNKSLHQLGTQYPSMNQEAKQAGFMGLCLVIFLVEDGDWQCAMVHSFPVPKNYWTSVPDHAYPEGWKEEWLEARCEEERLLLQE